VSVDREDGRISFTCDVGTSPQCENVIYTAETSPSTALILLRARGWMLSRAGAGYMHSCPRCPRPR
jgi:hypothetical protein